jgi:hypothetical protein
MKKLGVIIAVIAVAVGLFLLLKQKTPPAGNPSAHNEIVSENTSNPPVAPKKPETTPSVSSTGATANAAAANALAERAASPNAIPDANANTNEPAVLPPLTVLDKARVVIHHYRDALGENPIGTNPEITAALKGKNRKQIDFVADSELRVNDKGELVDGYGTPFFFHQISGQEMEIRSAGQDHVMWTTDDLVTK